MILIYFAIHINIIISHDINLGIRFFFLIINIIANKDPDNLNIYIKSEINYIINKIS